MTQKQIEYFRKKIKDPMYIASAIDHLAGVEADMLLIDRTFREGFNNDRKRNKKL